MFFSAFAVYRLIFLGILLFVIFRLAKFLLPIIIKKSSTRKIIQKYIPLIELFLWFIFLVWSLKSFVIKNQYFAIGLSVVMLSIAIWASWFVLKDYISGMIFKTNSDLNKGDTVTIEKTTGKITKFGFRTLQIESAGSKIIKIPYTQMLNKNFIKSDTAQTITGHSFKIKVKRNEKIKDIINQIKSSILLLPWTSLKKDPIIKPIAETSGIYTLEITVFALEKKFFYNIENTIIEKYTG